MTFQRTVNRNFTTGFPGEIVRDGPTRAKVVRLVTSSQASGPRYQGNLVGRVYGYTGEVPATGTTLAALVQTAEIGGAAYAGVLIHPKHYVLQGTVQGGTLAPSIALVDGTEAEVADMAILIAEVFNPTQAAVQFSSGDLLAYVTVATTTTQDPIGLPLGAIVSFPAGTAIPAGFAVLPGTIQNPVGLAASAPSAPVSTLTIIQLTH